MAAFLEAEGRGFGGDDEKEHLGHWAITNALRHHKWIHTYSPLN